MAQRAEARPKMLDTGVPNLDLVLGGGLQQHNSYLIVGPSGSGKSVLTQQIAFHRAKQGDRVLLVTGLDQPHRNLLEHFATLSFADTRLVGPQIETVSLVPFLDRPVAEKIDVLRRTVLNARPRLVLLEGLRSLAATSGSQPAVYQFLYGLTSWFAVEGITLLLTRDTGPQGEVDEAEYSLVDGVLLLRRDMANAHTLRQLWVWKMRGQQPLPGLHSFGIDADGITVWPRPQATFSPADLPESQERLATGVPGLDSMLEGGLPAATSTLLAGDPGAGKTILALAYLASGVRSGRPGLWVGFRESRSRLMATARQLGHDLAEAESRGLLQFMLLPPFELDPGRLASILQSRLAGMGGGRFVLDAAELLAGALPGRDAARAFLAWLLQYAPQQGVTAVITQQMARIAGPGFSLAGTPEATLADNVIILRQFRQEQRLRRALAVVKMSSPAYDTTIRELNLDRHGISVGEPLSTQEGQPVPRASAEPALGPV